MPEQFFRYIPYQRLAAWQAKGWCVASPRLNFLHLKFIKGFGDFTDEDISHVVIVEWVGSGEPVEPEPPLDKLIKVMSE